MLAALVATAAVAAAPAPAAPVPAAPAPDPAASRTTTILKVRPGQIVRMHVRPGGKLLYRVRPKTIYGRRLILAVTERRGAWAAVTTFLVPNGRRAWVHVDHRTFAVRRTRWHLTADLSARTLTVLHGTERVRTIHVAIGTRRTPTPHGTFAITDKLKGAPFGRSYGCCILALSGHQPKVRTGPIDGRLAIHGTDRPDLVGSRASQGCLRARDAQVRWLWRTVPVGTQLRIRG
jgi:lipoprotein-anchoring transpeptidase ErfK/SrfK